MTPASKGLPMPWWPRDFATDESVLAMDYEEQGVYRHLLDLQWLHGSIPADPDDLAALCPKLHRRRFNRIWAKLRRNFPQTFFIKDEVTSPARRQNSKLERVRAEGQEYRKSQSDKGKAGARARWAKTSADSPRHPPATDRPLAGRWPPTPTPILPEETILPKELLSAPHPNGAVPQPPKRPPASWPGEAYELWKAEIGILKPARLGAALKPAVDEYGWAAVKPWLALYCQLRPLQRRDGSVWGDLNGDSPKNEPPRNTGFCSPEDFVKNLNAWRQRLTPIGPTR